MDLTVGQLRSLIAELPDDCLVLDVATFGPTPVKAAIVDETWWYDTDRSEFAPQALLLASHPHAVEDLLGQCDADARMVGA